MKVGVIGLGARIAALLPRLRQAEPDMSFTAVMDPFPDRLTGIDPAPAHYTDLDEMLSKQRFDMLMIGSPNAMHLDHLRAALESDTPHIFTEKPVVMTIDETVALARLLARHDGLSRVAVGMVLRYSPLYRALRKAQADGNIGDVMSIEASEHIAPYHGSFFMRDWRRDSQLSGGFMLEKCCHDLDLYQGVVGARAVQIASFGGRKKYIPERRPETVPDYLREMAPRWGGQADAFSGAGDLIDYQTAIVRYANDATMAFHTNMNVPDEFRRFAVIGTDGMAEGDFIRNSFRLTSSATSERLIDTDAIGPDGAMKGHYGADDAMSQDLMAHLRGELPDLPLTVIDALEAGVTAMAMDRSRETGAMVDLTPVWQRFDDALKEQA